MPALSTTMRCSRLRSRWRIRSRSESGSCGSESMERSGAESGWAVPSAASDGDTHRGSGCERHHGTTGDRLYAAVEAERPHAHAEAGRVRDGQGRGVDLGPLLGIERPGSEGPTDLIGGIDEARDLRRSGERDDVTVE